MKTKEQRRLFTLREFVHLHAKGLKTSVRYGVRKDGHIWRCYCPCGKTWAGEYSPQQPTWCGQKFDQLGIEF